MRLAIRRCGRRQQEVPHPHSPWARLQSTPGPASVRRRLGDCHRRDRGCVIRTTVMPRGGNAWARAWRSIASTPVAAPCPSTTAAMVAPGARYQSRRAVPTGVDMTCSSIALLRALDGGSTSDEVSDSRGDRWVVGDDMSSVVLDESPSRGCPPTHETPRATIQSHPATATGHRRRPTRPRREGWLRRERSGGGGWRRCRDSRESRESGRLRSAPAMCRVVHSAGV
jgi:hypothetical protein